jgi:hypothetical protein
VEKTLISDAPQRTVEELWQSYAAMVGVPVGGVQWTETRRAFYAGAMDVLIQVKSLPDSEVLAVARMTRLEKEVIEWSDREVERARRGLNV